MEACQRIRRSAPLRRGICEGLWTSTELAAGHPAALLKTAPQRLLGFPEVPKTQTLAALLEAASLTNPVVAGI